MQLPGCRQGIEERDREGFAGSLRSNGDGQTVRGHGEGSALITDTEALAPGNYTIKATFAPGGSVIVPKSIPATYVEGVTVSVS